MNTDQLLLLASHLNETIFLVIGAITVLLIIYLRDYRLSDYAGNGYIWYLFEADRKQTDHVIVTLFGMICLELVTGALTGLEPQQILLVGAGIGYATKMKAGESGKTKHSIEKD